MSDGALQQRLEHVVKAQNNTIENQTASESRIRDTDMATESVAFINLKILNEAAQSLLAQASKSKEGVLSLLQ
jgi:flagellin